mmetsp:Transcript_97806/g.276848  ORF Transcript_97806/g.276848 Transcript_97806/m.276848 type:complete len:1894 (+) Transcript_97806:108-5789(+)
MLSSVARRPTLIDVLGGQKRMLATTRLLLKPKAEPSEVEDIEAKIKKQQAQLAELHQARAVLRRAKDAESRQEQTLQKFLQQQRQKGMSGAEAFAGFASVDTDWFSSVDTDTLRFMLPAVQKAPQQEAAWDGCTATSHVAYRMSENAFIFPITPSSPMAEICEMWSVKGVKNVFGSSLNVQQLQSEAGAAGSLHGSAAVGGLPTTFTSSQGLLLMIPNMYKIAGELLPCVMHVAARSLASSALSIFGDHQDVMAARATGWGMLSSQCVQDCHDLALVAHLATLRARVPIVHFQDGFRTSHEINTIQYLNTAQMQSLIDQDALSAHRKSALSPLQPIMRGSNQNPDVYMQSLESSNQFYDSLPSVVDFTMQEVAAMTGRPLSLVRYSGDPDPEHIIVQMGSAVRVTESVLETYRAKGERVGVVSPMLFRPWPTSALLQHIPPTVKTVTILDRTKEHGSYREPLFLDVAATLQSDAAYAGVALLGGRYGLGSKEYTPGMAASVFDNAMGARKDRFTVGIQDDLNFTSLPPPAEQLDTCVPDSAKQCVFFGLAGDGTVGANKNAVKIISDNSDLKAQAYFAYSSVKAGTPTVSHMRFGPVGMEAPYLTLPGSASYVACSFTEHVNNLDMLDSLKPGGIFVLNCPWGDMESLEKHLPTYVKSQIAQKGAEFYTIDASKVARDAGLGKLTNNIMQTAFFKLSSVLPVEKALGSLKEAIQRTYQKHGDLVVNKNLEAVNNALSNLTPVAYPREAWLDLPAELLPIAAKFEGRGLFVEQVQGPMVMMKGDEIPVSAFPQGGSTPVGLANNEKKSQADEVPEVDMDKCTQCNYCSIICPHGVIRPFLLDQHDYDRAPPSLEARRAISSEQAGHYFRIQVSAHDCTGCEVCVKTCPDDALQMVTQAQAKDLKHEEHWDFLRALPVKEDLMRVDSVKGSQMQQPLLEFSAACAGCGETPYMKLLTQLFGDRMVIANATGCSSIWGNPYGSSPYAKRDSDGKGPAWQNSLFEDNAEFGFGMAQSNQMRRRALHTNVGQVLETSEIDGVPELRSRLKQWHEKWQSPGTSTTLQDLLPALLDKAKAQGANSFAFNQVYDSKDCFVKTSQWIVGGDGWAYDIGFGGLDHVVASGDNVNILILDTESYSNTGGQKSKATPAGSIAKFAMGGKERQKKNLGEICMSYGNVYVASIAMGANMTQTVKALAQAEEFPGPSVILAYAPCIEHKYISEEGMAVMVHAQQLAVSSGYWPLFRFDPSKEQAMQLDQKTFKDDLADFLKTENRFQGLSRQKPKEFEALTKEMDRNIRARHRRFLAQMEPQDGATGEPLSILYGSETGNTAELAARFAGECRSRGYKVELAELNDLSPEDLASRRSVVIMIATCGEGQLPQNAKTLYEELGRAEPGLLSGVSFSVFALGDRAYRHFCSAGHDYERRLAELGATKVMDLGIGDDKDEDKFETGFSLWKPSWVDEVRAPADPQENEPPAPLFDLRPVSIHDSLVSIARPPRTRRTLLGFNKRISPADYEYSIRHMQFLDPSGSLPYCLGDALAVHWTNDRERVAGFLGAYGLDGDACFVATPLEGAAAGVKAERLDGAFRVSSVFEEMLDVFGRPSKNFLKELSKLTPQGRDLERLQFLTSDEGAQAYAEEITSQGLTFADVLLQFPSAKPTLNQLLTMLPVIKPRLYTIASSTRKSPGAIELTVITNTFETKGGKTLTGSCTDYFERHDTDSATGPIWMDCSISPGSFNFGDPEVPMVMTGTGTGVAPFLAFAKEREWFVSQHGKERAGEMWLFFGCRNRAKDYILGDELEELAERGILTHLRPAFSRDTGKKVYIQDKIKEEAKGVHSALVEKGGYLYLCGQAGDREKDVLDSVAKAFEIGGGLSPEKAREELDRLIEEGRYCPELY